MGAGAAMTGTYQGMTGWPTPGAVPRTSILSGLPPAGGGLLVYHHRSTVLTMPLPPWSRTHSTVRIPRESVPGAWSAFTYDQPTGIMTMTITITMLRHTHGDRFGRAAAAISDRVRVRVGGATSASWSRTAVGPAGRTITDAPASLAARRGVRAGPYWSGS